MSDYNENKRLITELRNLIVEDCCKQLNNVQNCGLLIDICDGDETLATGFVITNNKKDSWLINNMQIFDKAIILQEKWAKHGIQCFWSLILKTVNF